jgi:hypothetical protein
MTDVSLLLDKDVQSMPPICFRSSNFVKTLYKIVTYYEYIVYIVFKYN